MKRNEAFPSKYMSKDDVQTPVVATIDGVTRETLKGRDGEPDETKPILYFQEESVKPLVLNNINWMSIEDLYTDESDNWTGKKIELYFDPNVTFGSKRTGGVRVRKPAAGVAPAFKNTSALHTDTVSKWAELVTKAKAFKVAMNFDLDETDTPEQLAIRVTAVKTAIAAAI